MLATMPSTGSANRTSPRWRRLVSVCGYRKGGGGWRGGFATKVIASLRCLEGRLWGINGQFNRLSPSRPHRARLTVVQAAQVGDFSLSAAGILRMSE